MLIKTDLYTHNILKCQKFEVITEMHKYQKDLHSTCNSVDPVDTLSETIFCTGFILRFDEIG